MMGFFTNAGADLKRIELVRTIHPVGQGAFYSEKFVIGNKEKYTFIYDCGGKKGKLEGCIESFCSSVEEDETTTLFVSHFHADHINGIKHLRENIKRLKIYIPEITPEFFLIDLLYNQTCGDCGRNANGLLLSDILPVLAGSDEITDFEIVPFGEEKEFSIPRNMVKDRCVWQYNLYNIHNSNSESVANFFSKLLEKGIVSDLITSRFLPKEKYLVILEDIAKQNKLQDLAEIFKTCFNGNQNLYSMLVYSHVVEKVSNNECFRLFMNCLYTGDVPITDKSREIIRQCDIGMIQVPHHGSEHNFDPLIYNRHEIAFISVGEENRYNHPNKYTLDKIVQMCSQCRIISEESETLNYQFDINPPSQNSKGNKTK